MHDLTPHLNSRRPVIVAVPESDCHVVASKLLELYLKDCGFSVVNLGVTTTCAEIAEAVARLDPLAVMISGQNGHALTDLENLQEELRLRRCLVPVYLGGKVVPRANYDKAEIRRDCLARGITLLEGGFEDAHRALLALCDATSHQQLLEAGP